MLNKQVMDLSLNEKKIISNGNKYKKLVRWLVSFYMWTSCVSPVTVAPRFYKWMLDGQIERMISQKSRNMVKVRIMNRVGVTVLNCKQIYKW